MRALELAGMKFGRLVAKSVRVSNGKRLWLCACRCGGSKSADASALVSGRVTSCGCAKSKHGRSGSPTYHVWHSMKRRCYDPNREGFHRYGGRGLTYCARWEKFENFLKDMGEKPSRSCSLERIDNNKGYTPSNCRWATAKEQARNRSDNKLVTFNGKTACVMEWAERLGMPFTTLSNRLLRGWTVQRAMTQLVQPKRKRT